jgi:hypothetical protein
MSAKRPPPHPKDGSARYSNVSVLPGRPIPPHLVLQKALEQVPEDTPAIIVLYFGDDGRPMYLSSGMNGQLNWLVDAMKMNILLGDTDDDDDDDDD